MRERNIEDRNAERGDTIRQRAESEAREDRHSRVHQVSSFLLFLSHFVKVQT